MTKQELLTELNSLHSKIIELQDEAVEAWREATNEEDEHFFSEAGDTLSDMESDLGSFISENTESQTSEEDIDDEDLDDLLEEDESYDEMNEDPEEFFEKHERED